MSIRSTAKAIILKDGKILLNKCRDDKNGIYYSLPGGGQNNYETLHKALIRECLEETGYQVTPLRFAALCEEICDDIEFREKYPDYAHKMYHIFICELLSDVMKEPTEKDSMQISSEWIEVNALSEVRLFPEVLGNGIAEIINSTTPVFLDSRHICFNHG